MGTAKKRSDALHHIRVIGSNILGFANISLQVVEINGSIRVPPYFKANRFPVSHAYGLCIAIGMEFGLETIDIKEAIESYVASNNRSQIIKTNTNTILLDAYNSNPMSLEKAIQNLENIKHENKVMIIGDMFELGEETNIEHQKIIDQCLKSGVSNVFLVGKIFNAINNTKYKHRN